jgi:hypothetical protein
VTAARSTIPLAIDTQVTWRELRHEKHPGSDDVCLITLADGRMLHVDGPIFDAVDVGQALRKPAWRHTLDRDGEPLPLARGMGRAMSVAVVALLGIAIWISAQRG